MPIMVKVVEQAEFAARVEEAKVEFAKIELIDGAVRLADARNASGIEQQYELKMATEHAVDGHHEDHPTGWKRYVYSTNHKDIGTMYPIFAIIGEIIGGAMSVAWMNCRHRATVFWAVTTTFTMCW